MKKSIDKENNPLHNVLHHKRKVVKFAKKTTPKSSKPNTTNNRQISIHYISSTSSDKGITIKNQNPIEDSHSSFWVRDRILRKGTYACVFLAKNKENDHPHSKIIPQKIAVKSALLKDSSTLQFENKVLRELCMSPCSNVVHCFGHQITETKLGEKVYNLLLEYCTESTLHDYILKHRALCELEVRQYTRDILEGLCHIHSKNYIHCDLKPTNILMTDNVRPGNICDYIAKIADFGLSMKKTWNFDAYGHGVRGTRHYMSPELIMDHHVDYLVDIWALGCIVLEMLTGKQAWKCDEDIINEDYDKFPELPDNL